MKLPQLSVVKIGGEILSDPVRKTEFLDRFTALSGPKILVHGGGKHASDVARKMGVEPKMRDGRRITDADNLDVVVMVYAGLLNKKLVAELQAMDNKAVGISGADGNAIRASKRPAQPIDYGYAGDIEEVNADFMHLLLDSGHIPVICALTHDGQGQMLNTNADTIAAETAIAMSPQYESNLLFVFDKPGVLTDLNDESTVVPVLDTIAYGKMKELQQIHAGMIPKLDNGFHALQYGVSSVWLGNPDMLKPGSQNATRMQL